MQLHDSEKLAAALAKRGLVPPQCRLIEVTITPHSVVMLKFAVMVSDDDMRKFSDAFAEAAGGPQP